MTLFKFIALRPKRIYIEWFPVTLPELAPEFFPEIYQIWPNYVYILKNKNNLNSK